MERLEFSDVFGMVGFRVWTGSCVWASETGRRDSGPNFASQIHGSSDLADSVVSEPYAT